MSYCDLKLKNGSTIRGPVVFKVLERDDLGRPSRVQVGYDDTVFHIENGDCFVTGFLDVSAFEVAAKGQA